MSLNVGHALTGEEFNKNMVSFIICDLDTCFYKKNVNPNSASKMHLLKNSKLVCLLLQIFAVIIDL